MKNHYLCKLYFLCSLFLSLLLLTIPASAEGPQDPYLEQLPETEQLIGQAEKRFEQQFVETGTQKEITSKLDQITAYTITVNQFADGCIGVTEKELSRLTDAMDSLGVAQPNDPLTAPRKKLQQEKAQIEKLLAQCRLLNLRAGELQKKVQEKGQNLLKERLFARQQTLLDQVLGLLAQPSIIAEQSVELVKTLYAQNLNLHNLYLAMTYGLIGMLTGLFWSHYKRKQFHQQSSGIAQVSPALATVMNSAIRVSPSLLLFGLIYLSLVFYPSGIPAIREVALTLLIFTISYAILRAMLRPRTRITGFTPLLTSTSKKLFFWGKLLLYTTLLGALLHSTIFPEINEGYLLGLLRTILSTVIGLALIRLLWLLRKHVPDIWKFHLQWLSSTVILTAVIAQWLGYKNFSSFMFQGIFGTLFVLLLGWLLFRIPTEIFDGLDEAEHPWQQKLKRKMGLTNTQIIPGLIWLRLAHALVIFGGVAIILLRLWGMSEQSFNLMITKIANGYELGGFTLEPLKILYGLLIMGLLITLTQFVKRSLAKNWLKRTNLSRGAKEATVTITGYAGMAFALFIGLSVAGIKFTNLAIIAGALSVGIGFGLQNIVNNFISGLILLFERPIRRGDWIKVGVSEGYVKDISIRSTVIETFNRSDIIVPNSELISNQVTNMMLNNQYGRIIIPIRVAYGADTEKVMDTLRSVAELHPAILREHGKLQIQVFFRSFGENALNFELRCHIRDVEETLPITSELNLAIDKAFRKAGIVMPLPQQVVQVRQIQENNTSPAPQTT